MHFRPSADIPFALRVILPAMLFWVIPAGAQGPLGDTRLIPTATTQDNPPRITLSWNRVPALPANHTWVQFSVLRRAYGAVDFVKVAHMADANARSFEDSDIHKGIHYEYVLSANATPDGGTALNAFAYGQVSSGIEIPLEDAPGTILLLVDETLATANAAKLHQFKRDLIGSGWKVLREDLPRDVNDPGNIALTSDPRSVKLRITNALAAHPDLRAVTLIGRIPIPLSGWQNLDGHGAREVPTDAYYADLDEQWNDALNHGSANSPGDFRWDTQSISGRELMVGRIDFAGLPKLLESEEELTNRYFHKNHAFRHGRLNAQKRSFATSNHDTYQATTVMTMGAYFGSANFQDLRAQSWESITASEDFLWASAGASGSEDATTGISTDALITNEYKVVFASAGASYMLEYYRNDHVLRAILGMPTYGLNTILSHQLYGESRFTQFSVGLPIGAINLSRPGQHRLNPHIEGDNTVDLFYSGLTANLFGDPTLTMYPVPPPGTPGAFLNGDVVGLSWTPPAEPGVLGYHVYRSGGWDSPFSRLTSSPIATTTFTDSTARAGNVLYMIRAIYLETRGTGTYFNASQGVFVPLNLDGSSNTAPVATPEEVTTNQNTPIIIQLAGSDPDDDPIQAIIVRNPTKGRLIGVDEVMTYLPGTNQNGDDSFEFVMNDGSINSAPVTVAITIQPVNNPPVVSDMTRTAHNYGGVANGIRLNGTDVENALITFHIGAGPTHGEASITQNTLFYTPSPGFSGTDTIAYIANDGTDDSTPATITLNVTLNTELETNLLAWWKMDEAPDSSTAEDSIGSFPATLTSGTSFETGDGILAGAMRIQGANQGASIVGAIHDNEVDIGSLSLWFKADDKDNSSRNQVLMQMRGNDNRGWTIYIRNGILHFHVRPNEAAIDRTLQTAAITHGTWHHLALTYDLIDFTERHERFSMYLDGELIGMLPGSRFFRLSPPYGMGNRAGNTLYHNVQHGQSADAWFAGRIDDVRYYNADLTAPQVKALRDGPHPTTSQGTSIPWLIATFGEAEDYDELAARDSDGNGQPNWLEYLAGTNPLDARDRFQITSLEKQTNGNSLIRWTGSERNGVNSPFQVWGSGTLGPASWQAISPLLPRDPNGENTWSHSIPPSLTQYFYSIRIP